MSIFGDILSGIIGSTLAEWVGKLAPPRHRTEFDAMGRDALDSRNRPIYVAMTASGGAVFIGTFLLLATGVWSGSGWFIGLWFGFPFTSMLFVLTVLALVMGTGRVREFIRFFELKEKINVNLLIAVYGSLAALGVVSAIKLAIM